MRRYWFPIVLLLMIVVSIGTFYIRGVASDLPEYVLVPQHGKVEEAEGVIVRGDYVVTDISSPDVSIDRYGSKYDTERNFIERLVGYHWTDKEIEQLVKQYRSFMRGKDVPQWLYQDEQWLVYAELEDDWSKGERQYWMKISVLHKDDGQTNEYEILVPSLNEYEYPYVNEVQVFGDEIVLLLSGYKRGEDDKEFRRYAIDLHHGELLSEEVVPLTIMGYVGAKRAGQSYWNPHWSQPNEYNLFYTRADNGLLSELIRYDLQMGELEVLSSPMINEYLSQEREDDVTVNVVTDGDIVYIMETAEKYVQVLEYDMVLEEGRIYSFDVPHAIHANIIGDRTYILAQKDKTVPATLHIFQLPDQIEIFKGTIELKENVRNVTDLMQRLDLYGVAVDTR